MLTTSGPHQGGASAPLPVLTTPAQHQGWELNPHHHSANHLWTSPRPRALSAHRISQGLKESCPQEWGWGGPWALAQMALVQMDPARLEPGPRVPVQGVERGERLRPMGLGKVWHWLRQPQGQERWAVFRQPKVNPRTPPGGRRGPTSPGRWQAGRKHLAGMSTGLLAMGKTPSVPQGGHQVSSQSRGGHSADSILEHWARGQDRSLRTRDVLTRDST